VNKLAYHTTNYRNMYKISMTDESVLEQCKV